eukprot:6617411-Pyramimonas_sp.AAC.1
MGDAHRATGVKPLQTFVYFVKQRSRGTGDTRIGNVSSPFFCENGEPLTFERALAGVNTHDASKEDDLFFAASDLCVALGAATPTERIAVHIWSQYTRSAQFVSCVATAARDPHVSAIANVGHKALEAVLSSACLDGPCLPRKILPNGRSKTPNIDAGQQTAGSIGGLLRALQVAAE